VYVGFYEQQREGDQIHSPKHCLPGSGWRPTQSDVVQFETPGFNGGQTCANRYVIGKGDERQLVLYWYQSAGRDITNEYLAKVYLVLDSIFRKRNDGALIRFMAPLETEADLAAAQDKVQGFARQILPLVGEALPE
jgi:EpsI family protein